MSKNLATKVVFDRDLETVGFTSAAKEEISKLAEQSFHSDGSIIEKHEM